MSAPLPSPSRRDFLLGSAALLGSATLELRAAARGRRDDELRVGLVGCGGRGTGAAAQALATEGEVRLTAAGDLFADRITTALRHLGGDDSAVAARVDVPPERRFTGFDAFEKVLATDVDVVILATPPHFRPAQFDAAITAGKHVFVEKPVAVDGHGVRQVLAAGERAAQRGLSVVCGLQRHHQNGYVEAIRRVHAGAIGDVVAARCYWNMGHLWMHRRRPDWSDMEWQLRNWLYFTWLSGDHIVEQHVHNIDVVNWAKRAHPVRALGAGGRQVRTDPAYGHIYDHHSVHFEYPDGSWLFSMCRQMPGCADQVSEHLIGSRGRADFADGSWRIDGDEPWQWRGPDNNPYQTEHDVLFAAIRAGRPVHEARAVAESTLTAVMGRMATYTGRVVTWDEALASPRLGPETYELGPLPTPPVPMPGR
jgi:predicted dehydrogenase